MSKRILNENNVKKEVSIQNTGNVRAFIRAEVVVTWKDKDGNVYVHFSVREAMERFGCKHEKAGALFHILEEKNLITRYANGFGKPYRIVVRPICFSDTQVSDKPTHECGFSDTNKTELNYIDNNYTDSVKLAYRQLVESTIKAAISYNSMQEQMPQELLDNILDVIVDTICTPDHEVLVSGNLVPREVICDRLYALNQTDVYYVADSIKMEENDQNLRKLILTRLYEVGQLSAADRDKWHKRDG